MLTSPRRSEHSAKECKAKQEAVKNGKAAMRQLISEMQKIEDAVAQLTAKRDKVIQSML